MTIKASAAISNGYQIITCHLELNISQQFVMHKKGFYGSRQKNFTSIIFEVPL